MDKRLWVMRSVWLFAIPLGLLPFFWVPVSHGQTTSITSSGLNTVVTPSTNAPVRTYNITGGTRPGNGPNLFHSFGDFSVGTHDRALFLNDSGLATTNILGRVTGGHPSNIFGNITTTSFQGANLYLINPAGVVFGPSASLNVSGSVTVSTADYLRLADGLRFNAVPGLQDALLSQAPVVAFGFLNPHPRPISVQGATLEVQQHTPNESARALTLVGGDITIAGGTLRAPGGEINVVSVGSRGEGIPVAAATGPSTLPERAGQPELRGFQSLGKITMVDATVETSPMTARLGVGPIVIRGGQLVMTNSTVSGVSRTGENHGGPISINVSDTIYAVGSRIASGTNEGVGGAVSLAAGRAIRLTNTTVESNGQGIFGEAGSVDLTAPMISLTGNVNGGSVVSASGGEFRSHGEQGVTIHADQVRLENGSQVLATGGRRGGTVVINAADTVRIDQGTINVSALPGSFSSGEGVQAGNIAITAGESVRFNNAQLFAGTAKGDAGNIVIDAGKTYVSESGGTVASSGGGNGGNIIIQANERIRIDGGLFAARGGGEGNGGTITIQALERISIDGGTVSTRAIGDGAGGNITYESEVVQLRNNTTESMAVYGPGGTITIKANDFRKVNSTLDVNSQFGPSGTISLP